MSSLQQRIATVADTTANLIAQLRELDRLRDQVRDARLSAGEWERRYLKVLLGIDQP
jgi:hypothetical protein